MRGWGPREGTPLPQGWEEEKLWFSALEPPAGSKGPRLSTGTGQFPALLTQLFHFLAFMPYILSSFGRRAQGVQSCIAVASLGALLVWVLSRCPWASRLIAQLVQDGASEAPDWMMGQALPRLPISFPASPLWVRRGEADQARTAFIQPEEGAERARSGATPQQQQKAGPEAATHPLPRNNFPSSFQSTMGHPHPSPPAILASKQLTMGDHKHPVLAKGVLYSLVNHLPPLHPHNSLQAPPPSCCTLL